MASIRLELNDSPDKSSIVVGSLAGGEVYLTHQEALEVALELPMALSNLNGMFWSPVKMAPSSHVTSATYHRQTARLKIVFPNSAYVYYGVSMADVEELSKAPSSGSYIQQKFVKNAAAYPYVKL